MLLPFHLQLSVKEFLENAVAEKHKLPQKKKKKILPLILLVSLLGKAVFIIVSVNFLSDQPDQTGDEGHS